VTVREFARLALPFYRSQRWKWYHHGQLRVPSELEIVRAVRQLAIHKPVLRLGFTCRSGGLIVERRTAKTFVVSVLPRHFFRPSQYVNEIYDPVFHPVLKCEITL